METGPCLSCQRIFWLDRFRFLFLLLKKQNPSTTDPSDPDHRSRAGGIIRPNGAGRCALCCPLLSWGKRGGRSVSHRHFTMGLNSARFHSLLIFPVDFSTKWKIIIREHSKEHAFSSKKRTEKAKCVTLMLWE